MDKGDATSVATSGGCGSIIFLILWHIYSSLHASWIAQNNKLWHELHHDEQQMAAMQNVLNQRGIYVPIVPDTEETNQQTNNEDDYEIQ